MYLQVSENHLGFTCDILHASQTKKSSSPSKTRSTSSTCCAARRWSEKLCQLLADPSVLKVGFALASDVQRLQSTMCNMVDLQEVAADTLQLAGIRGAAPSLASSWPRCLPLPSPRANFCSTRPGTSGHSPPNSSDTPRTMQAWHSPCTPAYQRSAPRCRVGTFIRSAGRLGQPATVADPTLIRPPRCCRFTALSSCRLHRRPNSALGFRRRLRRSTLIT